MNWSLLAGGLSKGLEEAYGGANQGLLQGEQVRHQRAGEDIAQQHLGMQQQSLANTLAQQAYRNRLDQERFGLTRRELDLRERGMAADVAHRAWQQQHGGRELGLKEEMAPYEQRLMGAKADYYSNPMLNKSSGTERERWKNDQAQRMGFSGYYDQSIPPDVRAQIDRGYEEATPFGVEKRNQYASLEGRRALLNQLTQSIIANPPLSGADNITRTIALTKARALSDAMRNANQQMMLGLPPHPRDQAVIDSLDMNTIVQDLVRLQNVTAERGARAANPGAEIVPAPTQPSGPGTGSGAIMQKWGLR